MIAASLPGNMMLRTSVVDCIGGFPEGREFRGRAAGEDIAFRNVLIENFLTYHIPFAFLQFRVRPNASFDYFIDRTTIIDKRIYYKSLSEEEADGSIEKARLSYRNAVRDKINAVRSVSGPLPTHRLLGVFFDLNRRFESLRFDYRDLDEGVDPETGFALYQWCKDGDGVGLVLEIGRRPGFLTCWLAAGCRDADRGKLAVVGQDASLLRRNLDKTNLTDWVDHHRDGSSVDPAGREVVRFLVLDGNSSYEDCQNDLQAWLRLVENRGAFAIYGVGVFPGASQLYEAVLRYNHAVREVCRVNSLRIFGQR
jgi:hypothetical protein